MMNQSKPALILIHGFLGNINDWTPYLPQLQKQFNCLTLNLPGHGNNHPEEHHYHFDIITENFLTLLKTHNISSCYVLGYSLGGRVAQHIAFKYPHVIKKLILESASPGLLVETDKNKRLAQNDEWVHTLKKVPLNTFLNQWYQQPLFSTLQNNPEQYKKLLKNRQNNCVKGIIRSLIQHSPTNYKSHWQHLHLLPSNTLYITGNEDKKYVQIGHLIKKKAPHIQIVTLPHCSHMAHFENPQTFFDTCINFLNTP